MATALDRPRTQPPRRLVTPPPRRHRRRVVWLLPAVAGMVVLAPVVLFAGTGNPPCSSATGGLPITAPTGAPAAGMFAAPLQMKAHHWYRVGATEYGGGVGSSGLYLPDYPNTFAELSVLDTNPYPNFTFGDANALNNLPYGTAIRVANGGHQKVLVKRDIGYGQGPAQAIPYRIDVYEASAPQLGITKNPVEIELAPGLGTGAPPSDSSRTRPRARRPVAAPARRARPDRCPSRPARPRGSSPTGWPPRHRTRPPR